MAPDLPAGLIRFASAAQMQMRLAGLIADRLRLSIAQNGQATLALSGGKTPRALYMRLSHIALAWEKVIVTLVDERFVPTDHEASNEKLVRETLLQNEAAAARFIGLRGAQDTLAGAAKEADAALADLPHPFDVVVLGMGNDGHTASWFSGAKGLSLALDEKTSARCVPIIAPKSAITGAHTQRLTLTRSALADARLFLLVLQGQDKAKAYDAALQYGPIEDMPIRAILKTNIAGAFWPCLAL